MYTEQKAVSFVDLSVVFIAILANIIALFYQLEYSELPCPLCLLQRIGIFMIGVAALLNIRFGKSFKFDFLIVIASVYNFFVALRQVLLHIKPGDHGYGSAILGLHFYTWNDIMSFCIIVLVSISPLFQKININKILDLYGITAKKISDCFIIIMAVILILNFVLVYLECGFQRCADNPTHYSRLNYIK